jgi:putative transposase
VWSNHPFIIGRSRIRVAWWGVFRAWFNDPKSGSHFHDFPAEDWAHLRTSNVIESTFDTIRHRMERVKGAFSRTSLLAMLFKLAICAEQSFRRLKGFTWLAEVIRGVKFVDGVREHQQLTAA